MLIVRAGGAGRSAGTATRPASMPPKCAAGHAQERRRRRGGSRRSAPGSARIARIAAPAPPWRCRPRPRRIAVGRVCAKRAPERDDASRPAARRSRPRARPATRRGAPRARASPRVQRASQSRSSAPSSSTTRISPSASAASVPGTRRDVLVAALGRVGAQRVDRDDVRAAALRREHEAPLVEVRREQVRAPQDHQPRVLEVLGVHADGAAVGRAQRGAARRPCRSSSAGARRRARRTGAGP